MAFKLYLATYRVQSPPLLKKTIVLHPSENIPVDWFSSFFQEITTTEAFTTIEEIEIGQTSIPLTVQDEPRREEGNGTFLNFKHQQLVQK